jgi:serine/threonine-protein kinase
VPELAPGQTLDQYEILDTIACSGMATVFRARDIENDRMVALKVPYLQYSSDIVFHQRFLREEQIGLSLDHPAVMKTFRPAKRSRLYLVMEYVEGELLSVRLQRERRFPIPSALEFAIQIADVLVYLHDRNVVHRDLKPDNIMILPTGKIKLMDFGIAFDANQRRITWTGFSQPVGTPNYMAPEQIKGQRGSPRTDIYSLGIILYELLTGKVPFSSRNVYAAMQAKILKNPIPPRRLRRDISPQIEEILLRALERNPRDRLQSALEFRNALANPDAVVLTDRSAHRRPASRLAVWMWRLRALAFGLSSSKEVRKFKEPEI